jgi:hypothetical protein
MRLISFDPGGTTGVAVYDEPLELPGQSFAKGWQRFELGPGEHHADLWALLTMEQEIVYETFDYQRRDVEHGVSLELISREYIGIIKLHKQMAPPETPVNLYPQKPSLRTFWTDDKLRELGLWVSSEHERDATRHLLYYISFTLGERKFLYGLKHS